MAVNLSPIGGVAAQFLDNNGNPLTGGKIYTYAAGTTTPQASYTSSSGATAHSNPIILDAAGRVPSGEIWLTDGFQYKFLIKTSADVQIGSYDNIIGINSNFVNYTNSQEIQTATSGQTVFTLTTMVYQPGTKSLSVFVDGVNQYGPGASYAYTETSDTVVTFNAGLHAGASVKFTTSAINSSSATDAEQVGYVPPFTSSVPTNVEAKLAQTVSVKDFGAVGDGVTNDTTAIQAALDVGGSIYFPPGTYMGNDLIATLPVYIIGYGATIKRQNNQLSSNYILSLGGNNSSIQGLNFDGNASNNAGHTGRHEGLRVAADNVTVTDVDSSNTPSGGSRVANCFYVSGNFVTLTNVTSSNGGYAGIRVDGDNCAITNSRITNFTEKGIVFDGTLTVSANTFLISDCYIASNSTDVNGQACILVDSGSALAEQLKNLTITNVYCELTGNIVGSNIIKIANVKRCVIDGFSLVQAGTNHVSFRSQERVEYLTLSNGRMDYELNLDSWDYKQLTFENITVGKENKSLTSGSPISGLYAKEQIFLTNTAVYGATLGSVRVENWVGQTNSDGVVLTEPNLTINGFVQDANASNVPVLFLAMPIANITPGSIVVGNLIVVTGYNNAVQTITGSSSTERLIQRNPGATFSREFLSAAAPITNTWKLADRVYDIAPASAGYIGWVCTVAGTPGTWKQFGLIA